MCSSVVSVRCIRDTSSRCEMKPSRRATTALHMYAPMFVVDVCTLVLPSPFRLSAGSPDDRSVMAANDAHVRSAYWRSGSPRWWADALAAGTSTSAATSAASFTNRMSASPEDLSRQRAYPQGRGSEPRGFDAVNLGGETPTRVSEGGTRWVEGDASPRWRQPRR